jgi:excisionase family DNA binding protein
MHRREPTTHRREPSPVPDRLANTIGEVVRRVGVSRSSVYIALSNGELASFKLGKRRLVSESALHLWLARLEGRVAA